MPDRQIVEDDVFQQIQSKIESEIESEDLTADEKVEGAKEKYRELSEEMQRHLYEWGFCIPDDYSDMQQSMLAQMLVNYKRDNLKRRAHKTKTSETIAHDIKTIIEVFDRLNIRNLVPVQPMTGPIGAAWNAEDGDMNMVELQADSEDFELVYNEDNVEHVSTINERAKRRAHNPETETDPVRHLYNPIAKGLDQLYLSELADDRSCFSQEAAIKTVRGWHEKNASVDVKTVMFPSNRREEAMEMAEGLDVTPVEVDKSALTFQDENTGNTYQNIYFSKVGPEDYVSGIGVAVYQIVQYTPVFHNPNDQTKRQGIRSRFSIIDEQDHKLLGIKPKY